MNKTGGSPNLFIKPEIKKIIVKGTVFYNEMRRRINLRKDILEAFIDPDDRTIDLDYVMELYFDKALFSNRLKHCEEDGVLPVLLFFKVQNKNS